MLVGWPVHARTVQPVAIPIPCQTSVARNAQDHGVIRKPGRQVVLEVYQAVRWPEYPNAEMRKPSCPFSRQRHVVRIAEHKLLVGCTRRIAVAQTELPV